MYCMYLEAAFRLVLPSGRISGSSSSYSISKYHKQNVMLKYRIDRRPKKKNSNVLSWSIGRKRCVSKKLRLNKVKLIKKGKNQ